METNTRKERREAMSTEPSERARELAREWYEKHGARFNHLRGTDPFGIADLLTRYAGEREGRLRGLIVKWRESAREYERLAHVAKQRDPEQSEVTAGYLALMDERDDCADELEAILDRAAQQKAPGETK
jgi:hypothetical protein